uniref:Uncharacterized protein n=1 Tax=Moniliophthora roreri TaxID=221103 RepID=A0A0W0G7A2_MONRR
MEDTGFSLITKSDSTVTFKAVDTAKPSPNAKPDKALSWPEIMQGKNVFITNMSLGGYTEEHIRMFSQFYINMELHPRLREKQGQRAFVRYHAGVCWDWFESNEAGKPFDLANINEDILCDCFAEVQEEDMDATMNR